MQPGNNLEPYTTRDRSRWPERRACERSRKAARRAKSALLFMAWAFPADMTSH